MKCSHRICLNNESERANLAKQASSSSSATTRQSYTIQQKLAIAREARATGNKRGTARKYNVSDALVRAWVRDIHKMSDVDETRAVNMRKIRSAHTWAGQTRMGSTWGKERV